MIRTLCQKIIKLGKGKTFRGGQLGSRSRQGPPRLPRTVTPKKKKKKARSAVVAPTYSLHLVNDVLISPSLKRRRPVRRAPEYVNSVSTLQDLQPIPCPGFHQFRDKEKGTLKLYAFGDKGAVLQVLPISM